MFLDRSVAGGGDGLTSECAFDVVILGGGPAGAAAALSLKQIDAELQVLLVEATTYTAPRIGEALSPGGQALLHGLGCWQRFSAEAFLETHGTDAVWGSPAVHQNEFLLSARGSGWHLDRRRFDAMLAECASDAGVRIKRATRFVGAIGGGQIWHLALSAGAVPVRTHARFVIDATGRGARFARLQGARQHRQDRLVGVSVVYRCAGGYPPSDGATLVEASKDGWWYSAMLPHGRLLVAWMSDADIIHESHLRNAAVWQEHLARSGATRARVRDGAADGPPHLWPAATQHLTKVQGDGWVATGDAACAWDPLSSAGILKAMRTGRLAAFVALDAMRGRPDSTKRYSCIVQSDHAAYLQAHAWFYDQEKRWQDTPFWRRRTASAAAADASEWSTRDSESRAWRDGHGSTGLLCNGGDAHLV